MSPRRKEIWRDGRRGSLVRVVEGTHRGALVYWVLFPREGSRGQALFPRTAIGKMEAKSYAQGVVEEMARPTPKTSPITVSELFRAFCLENDLHLRFNSRRLYRETWGHFENFIGPQTVAAFCTRDSLVRLRSHLELHRTPRTLGTNSIRRVMANVRRVFRWGEDASLIPPSTVLRYVYRVAKERRPVPVPEYRLEEFLAIVGACGLDGRRWRAGAILRLCGYQGIRQNAVLHLRWEDVDWKADELIWRSEWDKTGKLWRQPMRRPTRAVLTILWERAGEPKAGWVFPTSKGKQEVYTAQSLWAALKVAERDAGIPHLKGRGAHGLRRLLAGEVAQITGNVKTALDAIGDTDIRMAEHYVVRRVDAVRAAFDEMDKAPEADYQPITTPGPGKPGTGQGEESH